MNYSINSKYIVQKIFFCIKGLFNLLYQKKIKLYYILIEIIMEYLALQKN